MIHVALRARFTLVSVDDGTTHNVETYGEALDGGDKATAKAMSGAYKIAMLQTFCVPVIGLEDADASSQKLVGPNHDAEPIQGWKRWCDDIIDIVSLCESEAAVAMVQDRNRAFLLAVSREQPDLYTRVGDAFNARRALFAKRPAFTIGKSRGSARRAKRQKEGQTPAVDHV